ncbi:hypothetical protein Dimus_029717 [Dionaea muscipula]
MAKRGRPRRVLFSVGLGRGSAVKTRETNEVQETDRVSISGSDGDILNSDELHASIDEGMMGDMVDCGVVSTDPVLVDDVAVLRDEPYLQALQKGTAVDVEGQAPNPLAGNRDTRRGLQLSNEEERNEDLVFTLEDVARERSYWDNALIGRPWMGRDITLGLIGRAIGRLLREGRRDDVDCQGRHGLASTPLVVNEDYDPRCLESQRPQ